MAQFIVSARKYRPGNFETLVGQDNIAKTLKNSILTGQLAHSYLFCGPRGVGKTSTARIFAKTINCENPGPNIEPCGACESCKSFAEGRSYCIHELDAASNNSVDDIRTLIDKVRIPPQIGKYSVYIIDEVHMLSQSAFNAFLKTLEEPPAHAIFILATTEKHKILPTILSRCQTFDFNRISIEDMVKTLKGIAAEEKVNISDDALHIIAQKADGSMRDALTLFDQTVAFCGRDITYEAVIKNLNVLDYEYYFRLTDCFLSGDYPQALMIFDEILSKGFNALHFISGLSSRLRDLIVCCNSASQSLIELAPSLVVRYKDYCKKCGLRFLYESLEITTVCEASYKSSGNGRLLIEFALMKMCMSVALPAALPATQQQNTAASTNTAPASPAPATDSIPTQKVASEQIQPKKSEIAPSKSSISSLLKQAMKAETPTDNKASNEDELMELIDESDDNLTEEKIQEAWKKLTADVDNPRIRSGLCNYSPIYDIDSHHVTQFVLNEAQKDWLNRHMLFQLQKNLQRILGNNTLILAFEVRPQQDDGEKIPYTTREVAAAMRQKNPELGKMEESLNLEIK